MKFLTNAKGQPLLQVGQVIYNLNTKESYNDIKCFRLKPGIARIANIKKNNNFLYYVGKYFKVQKLAFNQNIKYYMLNASNIKLFCIIKEETIQVVGNYPVHYLKLLCRFIVA